MRYFLRRLFNWGSRQWDIEGRCGKCGRPLPLFLTVINTQKIQLEVHECPKHLGGGVILWPQRDDIIRQEVIYTFDNVDIPKGAEITKAKLIIFKDGKTLELDIKDKIAEVIEREKWN